MFWFDGFDRELTMCGLGGNERETVISSLLLASWNTIMDTKLSRWNIYSINVIENTLEILSYNQGYIESNILWKR